MLDALHYCAAELERIQRGPQREDRPWNVYVCDPFSDDLQGNAAKVAAICRSLAAEDLVPVAPRARAKTRAQAGPHRAIMDRRGWQRAA